MLIILRNNNNVEELIHATYGILGTCKIHGIDEANETDGSRPIHSTERLIDLVYPIELANGIRLSHRANGTCVFHRTN